MYRSLFFCLALAAGAAQAQALPDGPRGPGAPHPPGPPMLSPEMLATATGLSAEQQVEVRRILIERRDAHEALRARDAAARAEAMAKSRAAHERIDDESSARLRKLLGDDGYRKFAEWLLPPRRMKMDRQRGPRLPGPPADAPAVGDADTPDTIDDQSPVR